jgi:hypothetical protein
MTREDVIRMAREAGWSGIYMQWREPDGSPDWMPVKESLTVPVTMEQIERFAALVAAAEREKVARWHIGSGYTTGHGDTIEDLLVELEWQVRESEREACAKACEILEAEDDSFYAEFSRAKDCAAAIRARGNK